MLKMVMIHRKRLFRLGHAAFVGLDAEELMLPVRHELNVVRQTLAGYASIGIRDTHPLATGGLSTQVSILACLARARSFMFTRRHLDDGAIAAEALLGQFAESTTPPAAAPCENSTAQGDTAAQSVSRTEAADACAAVLPTTVIRTLLTYLGLKSSGPVADVKRRLAAQLKVTTDPMLLALLESSFPGCTSTVSAAPSGVASPINMSPMNSGVASPIGSGVASPFPVGGSGVASPFASDVASPMSIRSRVASPMFED